MNLETYTNYCELLVTLKQRVKHSLVANDRDLVKIKQLEKLLNEYELENNLKR